MSSSQTSSSSSDGERDPGGRGLRSDVDLLFPIYDVRCAVAVVLGTGTLKVRDCLALDRQSIVRLDQTAGSDLEVRVQGVTVATGEVVILEDNTALRISRMTPPLGVEAA